MTCGTCVRAGLLLALGVALGSQGCAAPRARGPCAPVVVAAVVAPPHGASAREAAVAAPPPAAAPLPVLRVGTSADYAPFSLDGVGFDVEVAELLARDLGYRVEWVRFRWPQLARDVQAGAFDVAMSGVTLRPERAVVGAMTRAVAASGPCVLYAEREVAAESLRVAVNRGGILERWARARFPERAITAVDDNRSLPERLARGEVDAIVTDGFELAHFARPGLRSECEPPRDLKVYWIAPQRAAELLPVIDAWLAANEPRLRALRARFFGAQAARDELDNLVDLLARRLSLMPAVAAYKRAHGLPIEDRAREAVVLEQALDAADAAGLDRPSVRALFAEQIELAKAVQRRSADGAPMDLTTVLRPALSSLDARILAALAASADALPELSEARLDLLVPFLQPDERARLLAALRSVRRSADPAGEAPRSGAGGGQRSHHLDSELSARARDA